MSIFSPLFAAARIQRYVLYLQTFQHDIGYKKTNEHGNVDALSRLPSRSEDLPLQFNSDDVIDESEFLQNIDAS